MTSHDSELYDVLIVGAGVAGALIAADLASWGIRVLLLEAGPERADRLELVGSFARSPSRAPNDPYDDAVADIHAPSPRGSDTAMSGHYIQATSEFFKSTYQRLVGGSTWHWLGNTPRFVPSDFRLNSLYGVGVDWPITYRDLEPWYVKAEHELGVSGDHAEWDNVLGSFRSSPFPMPPIWAAYGDHVVASKIDKQTFDGVRVRVRVTPQARNSITYQGRPACAGNSSCVPICPIGAKYDATVHVKLAREASGQGGRPAVVRDRCVVKTFLLNEDGSVSGVVFDAWDADGSSRRNDCARAKIYVLAAHAIESPLILLESGMAKRGPVGLNLMDHLQGYGAVILNDPVYPFRGPPVTSGIDEFRDGPLRHEQAAFRISIGNDGWGRLEAPEEILRTKLYKDGLHGPALRKAINERAVRMLRFSYSTEMLPDTENFVAVGGYDAKGNPRPRITFSLPEYNKKAFDRANRVFREMFQALTYTESRYSYPKSNYSGAGHIVGTCRMGDAASNSVVDAQCRAHEHPNLYVVGASVFPTSGTANPTLTVAALALRSAEHIREQLRTHA